MISHSKIQFLKKTKNKKDFVFYKKVNKFFRDPVPYFMDKVGSTKYSFLYESVEKGGDKGRYTFCGYGALSIITNKKKLKHKIEALRWIEDDDPQFKYYCALLNIEPSYIKNKLERSADSKISNKQQPIAAVIISAMLKGMNNERRRIRL